MVAESRQAGITVGLVAQRRGISPSQLFTWRRQFDIEPASPKNLAPILPVTIAPDTTAEDADRGSSGQMEIVLAEGDRIIVWSDVETAALTQVLKALSRR